MKYKMDIQKQMELADKWEMYSESRKEYGLTPVRGAFLIRELGFDYDERYSNLDELDQMLDLFETDYPDTTLEQEWAAIEQA